MKPKQLAMTVLVLGLMAVSFAMGAGFAGRLGGQASAGVAVAQFPGDVFANESALQALQAQGAASLTPVETFWQVLNRVRERYYQPIDDEDKLAYGAAKGLMSALGDPYSRFLDPSDLKGFERITQGSLEGIGAVLAPGDIKEIEVRHVIILRPFPGGPAEKAGLLPGDLIVGVGQTPEKIENVLGMTVDDVADRIRGARGTKVYLSVVRKLEDPAIQVEVTRDRVDVPIVETKAFDSVAYIKLESFSEQSAKKLAEGLARLEGQPESALIIDLRGNGGGLLDAAVEIVSMFVQDGPVVYIKERDGNPQPLNVQKNLYRGYTFPIVVLTNGQTASAAEILSGALRDTGRAKLIGEKTFGKGLVQTVIPLTDGKTAMSITTAKYLTPNQTDINKTGIVPDFRVKLSQDKWIRLNRSQLGDDEDDQLQAALTYLRTGAIPPELLASDEPATAGTTLKLGGAESQPDGAPK
jgi:carboxyl-terminal processing protease